MRLEITATNIGVVATQNFAFITIDDQNGSRIDVTLNIEMLDFLEEAIAREKRVNRMIGLISK